MLKIKILHESQIAVIDGKPIQLDNMELSYEGMGAVTLKLSIPVDSFEHVISEDPDEEMNLLFSVVVLGED